MPAVPAAPLIFFFGEDAGDLEEYAWYSKNTVGQTRPVGTRKPNELDLYDMHGNVWDWVEDDWHRNYSEAPSVETAWIDTPRGNNRVIRGGGWYADAQRCGSAVRGKYPPDDMDIDLGFRVARSADPDA